MNGNALNPPLAAPRQTAVAADRRAWDNETWLTGLRGGPAEREEALTALRDYLLRAVYVYLLRRRGDLAHLDADEVAQLAEDCTQEALMIVLREIDRFRGDSRLTTWAYRIVINLAMGKLRRLHWRDVSLEAASESEDGTPRAWTPEDPAPPLERVAEQAQTLATLKQIIDQDLTQRQRRVLVDIVLRDLPSEQVAERLATNRNNIYKILHDARRKLNRRLEELDLSPAYVLDLFSGGAGAGWGGALQQLAEGAD